MPQLKGDTCASLHFTFCFCAAVSWFLSLFEQNLVEQIIVKQNINLHFMINVLIRILPWYMVPYWASHGVMV